MLTYSSYVGILYKLLVEGRNNKEKKYQKTFDKHLKIWYYNIVAKRDTASDTEAIGH